NHWRDQMALSLRYFVKAPSECLTADMLGRYLNGKLSEPEVARVEHHVEECSNCLNMLSSASVQHPHFRGAMSAEKCAGEIARSSAEMTALKAEVTALETTVSWRPTLGKSPADTFDRVYRPVSDYTPSPGELPLLFDHDRYRIQRRLGRGGMGAVYLATDTRLDRPVAIKVPVVQGKGDAATLRRFQIEAVALARLHLHHPNLCMIYDVATCDGLPYLTMRYIEGESLRHRLQAYRGRPG